MTVKFLSTRPVTIFPLTLGICNIERNIDAKEEDKDIKANRIDEIALEQDKFNVKLAEYTQELDVAMGENYNLSEAYKTDLKRYGNLLRLIETSSHSVKRKLGSNYNSLSQIGLDRHVFSKPFGEMNHEQKDFIMDKIIGLLKNQIERIVDPD